MPHYPTILRNQAGYFPAGDIEYANLCLLNIIDRDRRTAIEGVGISPKKRRVHLGGGGQLAQKPRAGPIPLR